MTACACARSSLALKAQKRLPAILFLQWLSCDTVEVRAAREDGWSRMLRRVARESGLVMMRVDKRGVGDSEGGPCSALDYRTELADHVDALRRLRQYDFVDPDRIIVFGASMGATYAPLVVTAAPDGLAGIMVWGGGAKTWFERTLGFERRFRERSGRPAAEIHADVNALSSFLHEYLIKRRSPADIAKTDPELGAVWTRMVETKGDQHYGRPLAFHHQAQEQDWLGAWARVRVPTLVLYGEYDWFEDREGHAVIADVVNRVQPGLARFVVIPKMDHHFSLFARPEQAVSERGIVGEGPAVEEMLSWLKAHAREPQ